MDTSPKTMAFNNASQNRDHNIYTEEFFGGADQFVYIGGSRYEDISAIQYTVRETLKPIYGYSSRKFDDVAVGTRIVQGVIKVPVRNRNYDAESKYGSSTIQTTSLTNIGTDSVPNWVYRYTPEQIGSNGEGYTENEETSSDTIAKIQTMLKKDYDYIEVTGINELNTQKAILDYKRKNGLIVNSSIDAALINRLSVGDTTKTVISNVTLKYMPKDDSSSFSTVYAGSKIIIEGEYGEYYYIQAENGVKGYISKSEVAQ